MVRLRPGWQKKNVFVILQSTPAAGLLDREALLTMGLVPVDDLRTVVRARDLYRRECLAAKRAFVVLHNAVDPLVDAVIGGGPKDECFNRLATFAYDREQDIRYEKVLARGYTQHLKGAGLWRVPITRQTLAPWPVPAATPTGAYVCVCALHECSRLLRLTRCFFAFQLRRPAPVPP